jgi:predicted kinase
MVASALIATVPRHAGCWRRPVLVALTGLPGSGKTELARYLAQHFPLTNLSTDAIRLQFGLTSGPATHAVISEVAAALLPHRGGVLWDGIHPTRKHRDEVREFAARLGAHVEVVYAVADDALIRERLRARAAAPDEAARDGKFVITPEHFERIAAWAESPARDESVRLVDTTAARPGEGVAELETRLRSLLVS